MLCEQGMEDGTSCYGNRVIQFYVGREVGGIRKKISKIVTGIYLTDRLELVG